jgi:hypothetical protein
LQHKQQNFGKHSELDICSHKFFSKLLTK